MRTPENAIFVGFGFLGKNQNRKPILFGKYPITISFEFMTVDFFLSALLIRLWFSTKGKSGKTHQ